MDAIIFDIDGTLANLTHRRGFVTEGSQDWKSFFENMGDDLPTEVTWLAEMVAGHHANELAITAEQPFAIFVCTGRPEEYRALTTRWLAEHVPSLVAHMEAMLMRPTRDYRPDVEIKREMLRGIRGQGYNVRLVVDDRPSVVQMWKDEGLTVLEVDSGEWESKPKVRPGVLFMTVGPTGAGKTTYVRDNFPADIVVSSDRLREQLTGDQGNQSMNDQVFMAAHAIVKARIESGLDTVFEATNLRARDRRAVRDVVPSNTTINYLVINRPIEERRRDAGWRDTVMIGDMPIIDKHDQTFRSGLKHILAGDNDPRVTVTNLIRD